MERWQICRTLVADELPVVLDQQMRNQQLKLVAREEATGTCVLTMAEYVEIQGCGDILVLVRIPWLGAEFEEPTSVKSVRAIVISRVPEMHRMNVESRTLRDHLAVVELDVRLCETHLAY